jgi:hypothetical protein
MEGVAEVKIGHYRKNRERRITQRAQRRRGRGEEAGLKDQRYI